MSSLHKSPADDSWKGIAKTFWATTPVTRAWPSSWEKNWETGFLPEHHLSALLDLLISRGNSRYSCTENNQKSRDYKPREFIPMTHDNFFDSILDSRLDENFFLLQDSMIRRSAVSMSDVSVVSGVLNFFKNCDPLFSREIYKYLAHHSNSYLYGFIGTRKYESTTLRRTGS